LSQGFPDDVQGLKDERLSSANETLNILLTHKATTQGADAACSMAERLKVLPESLYTIPYFHEGVLADGNTGIGATTCTRSSKYCVNSRTHQTWRGREKHNWKRGGREGRNNRTIPFQMENLRGCGVNDEDTRWVGRHYDTM
jgi:hypothetical protein